MSDLRRDLVFIVLQFLEEEKLTETMHRLERETGYVFNMKYLTEKVLAGEWEELKTYLKGFTNVNDNDFSRLMFLEISKINYVEALARNEKGKAHDILDQDIKVFIDSNEYKVLAELSTLQNVREHDELSEVNCTTHRKLILDFLTSNIKENPLFHGKLEPPPQVPSTLRALAKLGLSSLRANTVPLAGRMPNASGASQNQASGSKRRRTAVAESTDNETPSSLEDLPTKMVYKFCLTSAVTSMDFHPTQNTLLLVGSANGVVTLWDFSVLKEVASKSFKPWEFSKLSLKLKALLAKETTTAATCVLWSPDGSFIGVSFNNGLIHLYKADFLQHREIEAHVGSVNDIKFVHPPQKQLSVGSCGDDKIIKVWDLDGWVHFSFNGHEAPVYSVCSHQRGNRKFLLSSDINGTIKAWFYDEKSSAAEYTAPGGCCTTLLYNSDGNKLFCCGTSRFGISSLTQITEAQGTVKKNYLGLTSIIQGGVLQFHSSRKPYLAVGEDGFIKFWHMESTDILDKTDAEGGLQRFPRLRFDKEGNLLAVSTRDGFKILANSKGFM